MNTFTVKHNNKEYEFKPFSLIDIYNQNPCKPEFIKLLDEWFTLPEWTIRFEQDFKRCKTLINNINWLIKKGFGKEIVKETILKQGMILERVKREYKAQYLCISDESTEGVRVVALKGDTYIDAGQFIESSKSYFKTLEEVNDNVIEDLKIKE